MEKLNSKIQDHIDLHLNPAKKALNYIKENDWTNISSVKLREEEYDTQHLLNNKNIGFLLVLYDLAKEDLQHPQVKSCIKLLLNFYTILEQRFSKVEREYDWTVIFKGEKNEHEKKKLEIEFQTKVLGHLDKFKKDLRKINFGDETGSVNIAIHNDTPVPFMMAEKVEQTFPEVAQYMERKNKGEVD